MTSRATQLLQPPDKDALWRLYHENSKVNLLDAHPSDASVVLRMQASAESLEFRGYAIVPLPEPKQLLMALSDVIARRASARAFTKDSISQIELSTLLFCSCGISRGNSGTDFPRPFRVAPSGGALYPLEVFVYCARVVGLDAGLYHFNPVNPAFRLIDSSENFGRTLTESFIQQELAESAAVIVMMCAFFDRSTFKYGERGYRFIMLEAGHMAQNICLAATGLSLSCVPVGGFLDRKIDTLLSVDGISQSVVYTACIGGPRRGDHEKSD